MVRVYVPDRVFEISADEAKLLLDELRLTAREGANFDAAGAVHKLETPGSEPIRLNRAETWATLRGLDNLRNGADELPEPLLSLRDALVGDTRFQAITYDLLFLGDKVEESSLPTYSGRFEAGDRFLTRTGAWRVREVKRQKGGRERLTCAPFDAA